MSGKKRFASGPFMVELMVAVLVFAVAAAACVNVFAAARGKSDKAARLSAACFVVQTAAEYLRRGDEGGFVSEFDANEEPDGFTAKGELNCGGDAVEYELDVRRAAADGASRYDIALYCDGEALCRVTCANGGITR